MENQNPFQGKPKVYINGFNVDNTLVDFQIYLYENGEPSGILNIAPITAKNLAKSLLDLTERYEAGFKTKIENFDEMWRKAEEIIKKRGDEKNEPDSK